MAIKVSTTVNIDGGSTVSTSATIDVSAYGTIVKEVPAAESGTPGKVVIPVQPEDADHVKLVMMSASAYSEDLTYKATTAAGNDLSSPATEYKLDQPQAFVGDAVKAIDDSPKHLTFSNTGAEAVTVTIVVGRSAGK